MKKKLAVVERKQVEFYEDALTAVRASVGQVYVSVRYMGDALGLAQRGQVLRIRRHRILARGYEEGIILIPPGGRP